MGPPGLEEQERRGGHLPCPLEPRKPAGHPGEVPGPLRPRVEGKPGSLLVLEPKPHLPQPPGPFPGLWVLSIDPTYCPNLTLAQAPPSTAKASPRYFFSFLSSSFLLLWYCCTFWLLFHLFFYFYILPNISISFPV